MVEAKIFALIKFYHKRVTWHVVNENSTEA